MYIIDNFNHRMYTCTWFAADKPFIKRRCYVMLCLQWWQTVVLQCIKLMLCYVMLYLQWWQTVGLQCIKLMLCYVMFAVVTDCCVTVYQADMLCYVMLYLQWWWTVVLQSIKLMLCYVMLYLQWWQTVVLQCIKLDEKEIYKQMISQLSSDTSTVTPAAVSSTVSFRPRRDRYWLWRTVYTSCWMKLYVYMLVK